MFIKRLIFCGTFAIILSVGVWLLFAWRTHYDFSFKRLEGKESLIPLAIVGSGPAGLSAALYGTRLGFYTVVFEGPKPGGQLTETGFVENWPGLGRQEGPQIMRDMQTYVSSLGAVIIPEAIASIDTSSWPYRLITDEGAVRYALSVIIATGSAPRVLAVPGEREYWGKGVTTCALCDAPFYKGKDVVIVGGGDSALEQALQLAPHARTITILVRKGALRASAAMQQQVQACTNVVITVNREIKEIKGNNTWVNEIVVHDTITGTDTVFKIDGVFLAIGHEPRTALVKNKVKLRADGSIVVQGRSQRTSVPGIFAAGDVEDQIYRQAGIAAGAGIKAAIEAATFLYELGWHVEVAQRLRAYFYQATDNGPSSVKSLTSRDMFEKEVMHAQQPVIVDFYAPHCPSCMHMLPVYEAVARRFADRMLFYKVDTATGTGLDERFKVERIPCFIVFKQGQQVARYYTVMNKPEMMAFVEQFAR